MKILHVSPALAAGNVRQMAADLAGSLQARGVENSLLAPAGELSPFLAGAGIKLYEWKGGTLLATWRLTRRLHHILMRTRVDILMAYSATALSACVRAAGQVPTRRRPRVISVLSTYPRHAAGAGVLSQADALIALSAHLAKSYEKRFDFRHTKGKKGPEKTAVIPYGIDERLCHPAYCPPTAWQERWWRRRYPRAVGRYTLCVPAPLSPLHGQESLIPILNTLRRNGISPHVFLVGDELAADPAYVARLRTRFEEAELDGHVSWVSPTHNDLRNILHNCDVCLSLAQEPAACDRAVLEALCLGRPVVGYDHGAVAEMLAAFLPEGRVRPGGVYEFADTLVQWHAYRPELPAQIPPPYRLEDTVEAVHGLCCELLADTLADTAGH